MALNIIILLVLSSLGALAKPNSKIEYPSFGQTQQQVCSAFVDEHPRVSTFFSPGYPHPYPKDTTCIKIIRAPEGKVVMVEFDDFAMEKSVSCEYDRLEVRDGSKEDSPLIGIFCGSEIPDRIYSSKPYMWLKFSSDDQIQDAGFEAIFFYVPAGSQVTPPNLDIMQSASRYEKLRRKVDSNPQQNSLDTGNAVSENICDTFSIGDPSSLRFYSPLYPEYYPPNTICTKLITADPSKDVMLEFQAFDLEGSLTCNFDWVEVRDGPFPDSPLIGRYCGNVDPEKIRSTQRYMRLKFSSDSTVSLSGFRAAYKYVQHESNVKSG